MPWLMPCQCLVSKSRHTRVPFDCQVPAYQIPILKQNSLIRHPRFRGHPRCCSEAPRGPLHLSNSPTLDLSNHYPNRMRGRLGPNSNVDCCSVFPRTVPAIVTNEERAPRVVDKTAVADWMSSWRPDQHGSPDKTVYPDDDGRRFPRHLGGEW